MVVDVLLILLVFRRRGRSVVPVEFNVLVEVLEDVVEGSLDFLVADLLAGVPVHVQQLLQMIWDFVDRHVQNRVFGRVLVNGGACRREFLAGVSRGLGPAGSHAKRENEDESGGSKTTLHGCS